MRHKPIDRCAFILNGAIIVEIPVNAASAPLRLVDSTDGHKLCATPMNTPLGRLRSARNVSSATFKSLRRRSYTPRTDEVSSTCYVHRMQTRGSIYRCTLYFRRISISMDKRCGRSIHMATRLRTSDKHTAFSSNAGVLPQLNTRVVFSRLFVCTHPSPRSLHMTAWHEVLSGSLTTFSLH